MKWFYYVFPIIFAAIQTVFICLGEGVAHALNCILGNWESFVVMWLVMIGIWTIEKQRAEEQRQWIAKEREKFETLNRNL